MNMYIPLNITYASMVLKIEHIEDGHGDDTTERDDNERETETQNIHSNVLGMNDSLPHLKAIMMTSARMVPCMNL